MIASNKFNACQLLNSRTSSLIQGAYNLPAGLVKSYSVAEGNAVASATGNIEALPASLYMFTSGLGESLSGTAQLYYGFSGKSNLSGVGTAGSILSGPILGVLTLAATEGDTRAAAHMGDAESILTMGTGAPKAVLKIANIAATLSGGFGSACADRRD